MAEFLHFLKGKLSNYSLTFIALFFLGFVSAQTVTTDKLDYAPGEIAEISGSGWSLDSQVRIIINEDPVYDNHYDYLLDVDFDGTWTYYLMIDERHLGVAFTVIAEGQQTGNLAYAFFTDGNATIASVSETIISPNSPSSLGIKDNSSIIGTNQGGGASSNLFEISIYPNDNATSGTKTKTLYNATLAKNASTPSVIWNGTNTAGTFVADGNYYAIPFVDGNANTGQAKLIIIDNTNPTITLNLPLVGATVNGTINFDTSPLDAGGNDSNIDKVEFYLDGILIGTDASSSSGWKITNYNTTGKTDGPYTWYAKVFDKAGNNFTSGTRDINISNATSGSIASVAVGGQFGTSVYGTASLPTFAVTSTRGGNGTVNGTYSVFGLPVGVTSGGFAPSATFTSTGGNVFPDAALTLNVPASLGAGSYNFTVSLGDGTNTVNVAGNLVVDKADQTITWDNPSDIVYGTALSATQLNATVSVPGVEAHGALTYDPLSGVKLDAGLAQNLKVDVAGSDNYNPASKTVQINVDKADQTITWDNPSDIVYGTALSATQLNATVSVPGVEAHGALTYDPLSGVKLDAGLAQNLKVDVAGSDNYNPASKTVQINVDKADQTITWDNPSDIVYGTALSATQLNATVSVPGVEAHGALTYDPLSGVKLDAGLAQNLKVDVAGSDNYNPASKTVQINVGKATASIVVTPYSVTYDGFAHTSTFTAVGVEATPINLASLMTVSGTTHTNAATYNGDAWSFVGNKNYAPANGTVNNAIGKRPITISAEAKHKYSGQVDPPLTYQITEGSLVGSDVFAGNLSRNIGESSASYPINKNTVDLSTNYNLSYVSANLTIDCPSTIDVSNAQNPRSINENIIIEVKVQDGNILLSDVSVKLNINDVLTDPVNSTNGIAIFNLGQKNADVYAIFAEIEGCTSQLVYLPVYDPNGGFVTGGGWIDSPANAMISGVTGKANFGFNAKYKNGKNNMNEVDGNTNFQFKAGDLHFSSTNYNDMELVISGAKATYTGTGTVNGGGNHKFRVVAIDGDVNGGGGDDKFRIKIWADNSSSDVLYDNQRGSSESGEDASILGGGSIVIHKPKGNSKVQEVVTKVTPIIMQDLMPEILETLAASPNPVVSFSTVRFSVREDANVVLRVYDYSGRMIETLYNGQAKAYQNYDVDFQRRNLMSGIYIVKLTTDKGQSYDKRIIVE
jgi:hypothetical protein